MQQSDKHAPEIDDAMKDPKRSAPDGNRHLARPEEGDLADADVAHARPDEVVAEAPAGTSSARDAVGREPGGSGPGPS